MRVLALRGHGGMEQYKSEEWPEPVPGEGDALIEVKACGLNYLDIFVRRGMPNLPVSMPRIPGSDIAGIVRSRSAPASLRRSSGRVCSSTRRPKSGGVLGEDSNGGLCELIAFEADKLLPLSDSTSFEQAAALPVAYGSAYRMMYTRADVQPGELVLILGASGGVGTACTQLAKNRGCAVIACASSADKLEKLAALGADHGINYVAEDFFRGRLADIGETRSRRCRQLYGRRYVGALPTRYAPGWKDRMLRRDGELRPGHRPALSVAPRAHDFGVDGMDAQ